MRRAWLIGLASATPVLAILGIAIGSCFIRPFDVPEYIEIENSESAFLIPLEGDLDNQTSFPSLKFLEDRKVASKRIEIPHRWVQTGRMPNQGKWIGAVKLLKVDRRPITREWTKQPSNGTSSKDEAISTESKDSVNFSMGIAVTANIPEEKAAQFLYTYPSKSLTEMLDMEVRARVQQVISEEAAKYNLEELRGKKNEIITAVRTDVVDFFEKRGIQITTVAMIGGIVYENQQIQSAIDDAVKASQLKVAAEAKREAQEVENKTIKLAAEGKATATRLETQAEQERESMRITMLAKAKQATAEAEAKIKLAMAESEAEGIRKIAEARQATAEAEAKIKLAQAKSEAEGLRMLAEARIKEAKEMGDSFAYVQLRQIEAEVQRWKSWNGQYPQYWMQFGKESNTNSMVMLPTLPAPDEMMPAVKNPATKALTAKIAQNQATKPAEQSVAQGAGAKE